MDHNIDRLRFAALELLLRLSRRIPRKRASTIFLVNNLHHIVQVGPHAACVPNTLHRPSFEGCILGQCMEVLSENLRA